jgi:hypothetical protein
MIEFKLSFPLDSDGFLRRQCQLCRKEFKILLNEDELGDLSQEGIESFMLEHSEEKDPEESSEEGNFFCPYCRQTAGNDKWWTEEQDAFIKLHLNNIVSSIINDSFIRPLNRDFGSSKTVKFEGKELDLKEPWISPEPNDMEIFELPCCQRKIKIDENWSGEIYCYFCGFPHKCQ